MKIITAIKKLFTAKVTLTPAETLDYALANIKRGIKN